MGLLFGELSLLISLCSQSTAAIKLSVGLRGGWRCVLITALSRVMWRAYWTLLCKCDTY